MPLLRWKKRYSVGVKTLDDQHESMIQVLNDLHAAAMKGKMESVASEQLAKIVRLSPSQVERLLHDIEGTAGAQGAKASGIVLGWYGRGTALADADLRKSWKTFQRTKLFWR